MRLDAKLHKPRGLNAEIKRLKSVNVSLGGATVTSEGYTPPTYEGATIVTPTKASQTLETDGYFVKADIKVNPIPNEYIVPEGVKEITQNGSYDITDKKTAEVNVPIPDGYVKPQGVKEIVTNGDHDVTEVKTARVNVPNKIPDGYIKPSGTKQITQNGTHDVNEFQNVNVNVEAEIPEGYYDASGIDTEPSKVLSGEEFINESGKQVGAMPNNGAVNATIQGLVNGMSTPQPYTIPEGYHNGQGKVQISSDVKTLHDNIAQALRQKGQVVSPNYDPKAFPTQIGNIQTSTPTQEKTVNITESGTHTVIPDAGYTLSKVIANVNIPLPKAEYKQVTPTKEFQHVVPSEGKVLEAVGVDPIPDEYIIPSGELPITANGTYDVTDKASVTVNVEGGGGGEENQLHGTLDGTITSINSNVTKVISYACYGITTLTTVNLPNATSFGGYTFRGCSNLTTINAPKVTSLGSYSFYGCSKLTEVNFPLATSVTSTCFYQCSAMTKADFGVNCKSIAASGMAYCTKLTTLVLRYTGGVVSTTTNAFSGVSTYKGYVYVPKSLIEDYQATAEASTSSTNSWHLFKGKFRALEDYTVDGTVTGALDLTKI